MVLALLYMEALGTVIILMLRWFYFMEMLIRSKLEIS